MRVSVYVSRAEVGRDADRAADGKQLQAERLGVAQPCEARLREQPLDDAARDVHERPLFAQGEPCTEHEHQPEDLDEERAAGEVGALRRAGQDRLHLGDARARRLRSLRRDPDGEPAQQQGVRHPVDAAQQPPRHDGRRVGGVLHALEQLHDHKPQLGEPLDAEVHREAKHRREESKDGHARNVVERQLAGASERRLWEERTAQAVKPPGASALL